MKKIINCEPEYEELLSGFENVIRPHSDDDFNKYYYLYQYTDDIDVIIDNPQYPSMLNYVKTGLLTKEEMIEALKH